MTQRLIQARVTCGTCVPKVRLKRNMSECCLCVGKIELVEEHICCVHTRGLAREMADVYENLMILIGRLWHIEVMMILI